MVCYYKGTFSCNRDLYILELYLLTWGVSLLDGLKFKSIMICKSCTIHVCLISLYLFGKISSNKSCCTFELVLGMANWICTLRQDFMNKIGACPIRLHLGRFFGKLLAILLSTQEFQLYTFPCHCSVLGHNRPFASLVLS